MITQIKHRTPRKSSSCSRHISQSHIPNLCKFSSKIEQASKRENQIKLFHLRKASEKRHSLECIFKENYRIYVSLNEQQSTYRHLFQKDDHKEGKKISNRYKSVLNALPKQ
jgi:hypothetical protein